MNEGTYSIFLKLEGVVGSDTSPAGPGWISVNSYALDNGTGSSPMTGGGSSVRETMKAVRLVLKLGPEAAQLSASSMQGHMFRSAAIAVFMGRSRRSQIDMANVWISNFISSRDAFIEMTLSSNSMSMVGPAAFTPGRL